MRVCLKCGHKDSLIWRNNPHRLYTSYCRLDELEDWEPKIAEQVKKLKDCKIQGYIYHLNEKGFVCRIYEADSIDGKSYREPRTERRLMLRIGLKGQTKLNCDIIREKEIMIP